MNDKYYFECINCGTKYSADEVTYLCPQCEQENDENNPPKGVLKTLYYYKKVKTRYKKHKLFDKLKEKEFRELLPIQSERSLSWLKVGKTPLYEIKFLPQLQSERLPFKLYLKDDSQNPTYSFKDRAAELICAYAREHNINTISTASTGNAGASLAAICASQNQQAVVFLPTSTTSANIAQINMYNAKIIPVEGNYEDAFNLSLEAAKKFDWYNSNPAYNPFTIEGEKIVSFEIYQQMKRELPDRIFVPVGDGTIISGVYKGFEDLLKIGLIEKIPTIVAVQSENSCNLINNLNTDKFQSAPANTIAKSISVNIPHNFYMTRHFIKQYNGEWITITDDEIKQASHSLSSNTGLFAEPAAAAGFAAMLKYMSSGKFETNSKNLVLLTGTGLKDMNVIQDFVKIPEPIKSLDQLQE